MRRFRYRAVITLDPAQPASERPSHWLHGHGHGYGRHRHQGPLPVPHPRSTAQTGPGVRAATAASAVDADAGEVYLSHTHELMLRAESPEKPGHYRSFAAELAWDDEVPLHPGDRHVVTVTVTDDEAPAFLGAGQRFTLWSGSEVGHGTITRQMFSYTEYGPC